MARTYIFRRDKVLQGGVSLHHLFEEYPPLRETDEVGLRYTFQCQILGFNTPGS